MNGERTYRDEQGRVWTVTLDAPGQVMSVAPELERSGALLPEHQVQITFTLGDQSFSEEYTAMTELEELSEEELEEWFRAALRQKGV